MYVIFDRKYDHTWPNRAVTAYPAGWKGPVKKEVGDAAIAAGAAHAGKPDDEAPEQESTLPGNLPIALAEPDALTPNRHVADGSETQ
jgi:hypothetical protein